MADVRQCLQRLFGDRYSLPLSTRSSLGVREKGPFRELSGSDSSNMSYSDAPTADVEGHLEEQALYAGQSAGVIRDCKEAAEIVANLVGETECAMHRLFHLSEAMISN
jgi:hypothetical protein